MSAADLQLLAPAVCAGALVLLTHVPLGRQVLRRGIVFLDLAVAQFAALGVLLAGQLGLHSALEVQLLAAAAALLGAGLLAVLERWQPQVQEAQIGAAFVVAANGGILLLASDAHGAQHLHDVLAGQLLWVDFAQLLLPALVSAVIVLLLGYYGAAMPRLLFYLAFALAVTVSVQLVGVYLVFASLILPALAAHYAGGRRALSWAVLPAVAAYAGGLLLSLHTDLPASPLIVCGLLLGAVLPLMARLLPRRAGAGTGGSAESP